MELTAENVCAVFKDCLFKDEEVVDGKPVLEPVMVEGVRGVFGFHPKRLEVHKESITELLMQLPEQFQKDKGGGWTFLNACMTKDDCQWGEQKNVEQLLVLGLATNKVAYSMPRDMWHVLPGGMPYFFIL